MYVISIFLFGLGSLMCTFSASAGGFTMLLLSTLEGMRPELEGIFHKGLNGGFRDMYLMVAALSGLAIIVPLFCNFRKREEDEISEPT